MESFDIFTSPTKEVKRILRERILAWGIEHQVIFDEDIKHARKEDLTLLWVRLQLAIDK